MKWTKLLSRLVTCALIGAAATVAVAWGLVLAMEDSGKFEPPGPVARWAYAAPSHWVATPSERSVAEGAGVTVEWTSASHNHGSSAQIVTLSGLPFRALGAREDYTVGIVRQIIENREVRAGMKLPDRWARRRLGSPSVRYALPTVPRWRGVALDTVFYGAVAFALWSLPSIVRRHLRPSADHCPHCRYDLSGLPPGSPCPECAARPKE